MSAYKRFGLFSLAFVVVVVVVVVFSFLKQEFRVMAVRDIELRWPL